MEMTAHKPKTPGWYWYEHPGSWALQPVLVFDGGPGGLMYTLDPLGAEYDEEELDGLWLADGSKNALWSDVPIETPNA